MYAGDPLSVTVEVVEKRSGDDPSMGQVDAEVVTTDDRDDVVLTMVGLGLVERREPPEG